MSHLSEQFHEQYSRFQQQFEQWSPFEQCYASVELSKKLQLSYRHFLSQFLVHVNLKSDSNEMFNHTVHQANTPAILACLLCDPLDKMISTLQLYLPLLSLATTNEKLLEAYRDVFVHLDGKLANPANFSYPEKQLIQFCQQIRYFIQINPSLQKFLVTVPQLTALALSHASMIHQGITDENAFSTQRNQQPLQRYPSVRSYTHTAAPLMSVSSEGSPVSSFSTKLNRADYDSGIYLNEAGMNSSVQSLLSHSLVGRSNSANVNLPNGQDNLPNHPFVGKTASSPIPEQSVSHTRSTMIPLSAVLSAPAPSNQSYYSDFQPNYASHQLKPTLSNSGDENQEAHGQGNYMDRSLDPFSSDMGTNETSKRLMYSSSLRTPTTRTYGNNANNDLEGVSPYLGIDGNSNSVRNTFTQANSGMRDVPKWLKNLRLHKYAFFFSQMSYDQMMNLTIDQLKEGKITDGACTKILLNIKKLKERPALLQKCLIEIDHDQIEMKVVLQQLRELMLTPIRAKQNEPKSDNDEDLPKLIMQVLEKVYQRLTVNTSSTAILSDLCNNLVGLFDRCYKHEAFSATQRHTLLHWRGPLCTKLQSSGKIEFKSMQSSSSSSSSSMNRRVQLKPQTSMGNMSTSPISKPAVRNIKSNSLFYSNFPSSPVPLSRQHNSDAVNQNDSSPSTNNSNNKSNESNVIRRPVKSPTLIFTTNTDDDNDNALTSSASHQPHLSIVTSHSLQEQSLYHQQAPPSFVTERSGFGTGNLRPSFSYRTSTPQHSNGAYLAANQHQLLARKTSIDPYGQSSLHDKTKLCKTFSDPSKIRFYSPAQLTNFQSSSSSTCSPMSSQAPVGFESMSNSYSSQRTYLSRSPPPPTNDHQHAFNSPSGKDCSTHTNYSSTDASVFYEESDPSNISGLITAHENATHNHRHNSTEFEFFCRQITASALGDDVHDSSMNASDDFADVQTKQSSSNSSTDVDQ